LQIKRLFLARSLGARLMDSALGLLTDEAIIDLRLQHGSSHNSPHPIYFLAAQYLPSFYGAWVAERPAKWKARPPWLEPPS
jgi:hypothetical protein